MGIREKCSGRLVRNGMATRQGRVSPGAVLGIMLLLGLLAGCANVGHDFPDERVTDIRLGETRQQEIREMFGDPWRVGYEDGMRTWTYGKYHYTILGSPTTKDLVIRFNEDKVVTSYSYNTTEHDENTTEHDE